MEIELLRIISLSIQRILLKFVAAKWTQPLHVAVIVFIGPLMTTGFQQKKTFYYVRYYIVENLFLSSPRSRYPFQY